jgi:hypothetical protein
LGLAAYEKQQKRIKALKKSGKVTTDVSKTSSRDSATKQKQRAMVTANSKGKRGGGGGDSDEEGVDQEELLQPLKDYVVRLFFTSAGGTHRSVGVHTDTQGIRHVRAHAHLTLLQPLVCLHAESERGARVR